MYWRAAIVLSLLTLVLGGCAPKRVASNGVVVPAEPRRDTKQAPADRPVPDLPEPEPLSRSGADTPAAPATRPAGLGERAVALAEAQKGKPYQWGAAGPDKFDCSGLVQYVYANLGVPLPRVSGQQASSGVHVDREDLRPGDLVFFAISGVRIDHVGIYVGAGKFIHAPRRYHPVREDTLHNSWWRRKFKGGRRVG